MNPDKPYSFQSDAVAWLNSPRDNGAGFQCEPRVGLIADEMGLGKTITALTAIRDLIAAGKRILFLVPGATIIQWQRQFDKWVLDCEPDEFGDTSLFTIKGSSAPIPKGVNLIISHSLMAKKSTVEKLIACNFDAIIIDEIHKFGSLGTKRIRNLWALINLTESHFNAARIGLTGTPVRNYAKEIYNIAHFLCPTKFRNQEQFTRDYLTYDKKALRNPQQFHNDFSPFYIRRMVSEVQKDLPEIRRTKLYTQLTDPFVVKAYNAQLDLMANFCNNASKINAFSLLGYLQKMRHITGIGKAREPGIIEPILEYIDGDPNNARKVVLGLHHHEVARQLIAKLDDYKIFSIRGGMDGYEKERVKNEFIKYKAPAVLLLSIKAAGEGIDGLQYASNKAYVFERQWNGADELQFEKRIHRTGQTQSCHIEYTIAAGTVDEFFDALVDEKRRYTTQVEDENWESNPAFLNMLCDSLLAAPRLTAAIPLDIEEWESITTPKRNIEESIMLGDSFLQ